MFVIFQLMGPGQSGKSGAHARLLAMAEHRVAPTPATTLLPVMVVQLVPEMPTNQGSVTQTVALVKDIILFFVAKDSCSNPWHIRAKFPISRNLIYLWWTPQNYPIGGNVFPLGNVPACTFFLGYKH